MPLANDGPILAFDNGASAIAQGKVVKLSAGKTVVTAANTDVAFGVITEDASADGQAAVAVAGSGAVVLVEAHGVVALGADLMPAAAGRAATATSGKHVLGVALEAATAQGALIKVVLGQSNKPTA
jgi:hypothetical protein